MTDNRLIKEVDARFRQLEQQAAAQRAELANQRGECRRLAKAACSDVVAWQEGFDKQLKEASAEFKGRLRGEV